VEGVAVLELAEDNGVPFSLAEGQVLVLADVGILGADGDEPPPPSG